MPKPTVVLVHGANCPPALFKALIAELESHAYAVKAPRLPSIADEVATPDMSRDVEVIRGVLESDLGASESDVVVVAHSYGGMPASAAVEGLDKTTRRAAGKTNGVIGLIYISATLPDKGHSLFECRPKEEHEAFLAGKHDIRDGFLHYTPEQAISFMLNTQSKEVADEAASKSVPWAVGPCTDPMKFEPWSNGFRCAYVWRTEDHVQNHEIQEFFTKGRGMDVFKWPGDHSAFLDRPRDIANIVRWYAGEDVDVGEVTRNS